MVAFADDFSYGGSINLIELPQESKCWLIVKPKDADKAEERFGDTQISITMEGKKHLEQSSEQIPTKKNL